MSEQGVWCYCYRDLLETLKETNVRNPEALTEEKSLSVMLLRYIIHFRGDKCETIGFF